MVCKRFSELNQFDVLFLFPKSGLDKAGEHKFKRSDAINLMLLLSRFEIPQQTGTRSTYPTYLFRTIWS